MKPKPFFLFLVLAVLSVAAVGLKKDRPYFETSLEALVGKESVSLPGPVRRAASSKVQVISSSPSFEAAVGLAEEFYRRLDSGAVVSPEFRVEGGALPELLGFYRNHRGGLMSERDRDSAVAGKLEDEVFGRIVSSSPSLFPFRDDPFRILDDFVKTRPRGFGKWRMKDGVLAAEDGGLWHVLVSFGLPEDSAFDIRELPGILGPVVETCRMLNERAGDAELSVSGVPLHTYETSSRCERQITLLSVFSLLFIGLLSVFVFRSFKAVALVAVNLAFAASAGFAALVLAFDSIHLLSLVFGTTLIGLAVDYSFHALFAGGGENSREVRDGLLKSFATTVVGFLPLAFSGIGALAQTALFLVCGLFVSLLFNLTVPDPGAFRFPVISLRVPAAAAAGRFVVPAFLAVSVCVFFTGRFRTEAKDLHSPSPRLASAERLSARLGGIAPDSGMAVIGGGSLDEALEKEETFFPDALCLSRFIPSAAARERNFRLIEGFYGKSSAAIASRLGSDTAFPPPARPGEIAVTSVPGALAGQFLFPGEDGSVMTLVPAVKRAVAEEAARRCRDVRFYAPGTMIAEIIDGYGRRACRLLTLSFVLLSVLLSVFYRWRSPVILLPSVLGVTTMFAVVSFTGSNINFFHLLASFMIIGMALDYTIFLSSDFGRARKAVCCSLLTSLAGFGALAFVSFPIVRSLGVALAAGLPVSFMAACALFRPRRDSGERAATPVGMEISWWLYRLFGKRALDLTAMTVANAVWLFDSGARRAAKSRRRLVNFALSLGDKIAVLSMGRGQPRIVLDDTADARAFVSDVASRKGAVVVSSHLGNIETLAAYGECAAEFHVFMSLDRTGVFRAFKERHARRSRIEVHPTEGFGMAELFAASAMVERGDVVLIAGDRGGGRSREMPFLGGKRAFPEGAFRFARHLDRHVYFVASVRERSGYRVFVKRLSGADMLGEYVSELERLVGMYPEQWYQWEGEGEENG